MEELYRERRARVAPGRTLEGVSEGGSTKQPSWARLPPHLQPVMAAANNAYLRGEWSLCERKLEEVIHDSRNYAQAWHLLSQVAKQQRQFDKALVALQFFIGIRYPRKSLTSEIETNSSSIIDSIHNDNGLTTMTADSTATLNNSDTTNTDDVSMESTSKCDDGITAQRRKELAQKTPAHLIEEMAHLATLTQDFSLAVRCVSQVLQHTQLRIRQSRQKGREKEKEKERDEEAGGSSSSMKNAELAALQAQELRLRELRFELYSKMGQSGKGFTDIHHVFVHRFAMFGHPLDMDSLSHSTSDVRSDGDTQMFDDESSSLSDHHREYLLCLQKVVSANKSRQRDRGLTDHSTSSSSTKVGKGRKLNRIASGLQYFSPFIKEWDSLNEQTTEKDKSDDHLKSADEALDEACDSTSSSSSTGNKSSHRNDNNNHHQKSYRFGPKLRWLRNEMQKNDNDYVNVFWALLLNAIVELMNTQLFYQSSLRMIHRFRECLKDLNISIPLELFIREGVCLLWTKSSFHLSSVRRQKINERIKNEHFRTLVDPTVVKNVDNAGMVSLYLLFADACLVTRELSMAERLFQVLDDAAYKHHSLPEKVLEHPRVWSRRADLLALLGKFYDSEGLYRRCIDVYSEQKTQFSQQLNELERVPFSLEAEGTRIVRGKQKAVRRLNELLFSVKLKLSEVLFTLDRFEDAIQVYESSERDMPYAFGKDRSFDWLDFGKRIRDLREKKSQIGDDDDGGGGEGSDSLMREKDAVMDADSGGDSSGLRAAEMEMDEDHQTEEQKEKSEMDVISRSQGIGMDQYDGESSDDDDEDEDDDLNEQVKNIDGKGSSSMTTTNRSSSSIRMKDVSFVENDRDIDMMDDDRRSLTTSTNTNVSESEGGVSDLTFGSFGTSFTNGTSGSSSGLSHTERTFIPSEMMKSRSMKKKKKKRPNNNNNNNDNNMNSEIPVFSRRTAVTSATKSGVFGKAVLTENLIFFAVFKNDLKRLYPRCLTKFLSGEWIDFLKLCELKILQLLKLFCDECLGLKPLLKYTQDMAKELIGEYSMNGYFHERKYVSNLIVYFIKDDCIANLILICIKVWTQLKMTTTNEEDMIKIMNPEAKVYGLREFEMIQTAISPYFNNIKYGASFYHSSSVSSVSSSNRAMRNLSIYTSGVMSKQLCAELMILESCLCINECTRLVDSTSHSNSKDKDSNMNVSINNHNNHNTQKVNALYERAYDCLATSVDLISDSRVSLRYLMHVFKQMRFDGKISKFIERSSKRRIQRGMKQDGSHDLFLGLKRMVHDSTLLSMHFFSLVVDKYPLNAEAHLCLASSMISYSHQSSNTLSTNKKFIGGVVVMNEQSERNFAQIKGLAHLKEYVKLSNHSTESLYNMARGLHGLGLFTPAVHFYRKAINNVTRTLCLDQRSNEQRRDDDCMMSDMGDMRDMSDDDGRYRGRRTRRIEKEEDEEDEDENDEAPLLCFGGRRSMKEEGFLMGDELVMDETDVRQAAKVVNVEHSSDDPDMTIVKHCLFNLSKIHIQNHDRANAMRLFREFRCLFPAM